MKRLIASLCVAGLVACTGCNNTSGTGGRTSGATHREGGGTTSTTTTTSGKNEEFKLTGPVELTPITVKQGEMKEIDIGISRTNFKDNVAVTATVEGATDGKVKAELKDKVFKGSEPKDKKIAMNVSAADDAKVGDYTIDVTGKPEAGAATAEPLKVKIKVAAKK
jgi:hypothetical protein